MENYGGDATASKRPIEPRKQPHREKKKTALRQKKKASRQSDLQPFEKDHGRWRPPFTGGPNFSPVVMGDGSIGFRSLTLEEAQELAKAKAEERANRFKERVNLMAKLADRKKKYEVKLADAKKKEEAKLADAKKEEEAKLADAEKEDAEILVKLDRLEDDRNKYLLQHRLTWEQKVVNILQMVRCRELTEYNHKLGFPAHTRFCCAFNTAFFDLDKESEGMPWKPIDQIPSPRNEWLADSVNVLAIKVAKSDRDYPISVFGTVLARDEYDYRCVYLFKRGRDDPQVITSKDDTLTLMCPYRALAVNDSTYFEFHLKVKAMGIWMKISAKVFLCIVPSVIRSSQ